MKEKVRPAERGADALGRRLDESEREKEKESGGGGEVRERERGGGVVNRKRTL